MTKNIRRILAGAVVAAVLAAVSVLSGVASPANAATDYWVEKYDDHTDIVVDWFAVRRRRRRIRGQPSVQACQDLTAWYIPDLGGSSSTPRAWAGWTPAPRRPTRTTRSPRHPHRVLLDWEDLLGDRRRLSGLIHEHPPAIMPGTPHGVPGIGASAPGLDGEWPDRAMSPPLAWGSP